MGFAPHFAEILRLASEHGADAVVFSLWSHDARKLGQLRRSLLFPRGTQHQAVMLGVTRSDGEAVEVHFRSQRSPVVLKQRFGRTSDPESQKKALLGDLPDRLFGPTAMLFCGETNMIRTVRHSREIVDEYRLLPRLRRAGVRLLLNPIHDYMRRFEMPLKRQALSRATGTVACVWNRGCKGGTESTVPWAAYRDGRTITDQIEEVRAVDGQTGVRIGLLNLA